MLLHFLNDKGLYNTIEFIYSIALIVNIFIDFGTRGYMTYSFRFHTDAKVYTFSIVKLFNLLLIIYIFFFFLIAVFLNTFPFLDLAVVYFIFIRSIYLCVINIYRSLFLELIQTLLLIFIWSIPVQIVTALIIMMFYYR